MKKYFLLATICCVFNFSKLFSQCNVAIPPNAVVINNDTTIGMVNQIFWVCSGDTLSGSGVDNVYYVEPGGALDMSGIHKIAYLKAGASINCSGIDDTIYYEAGAIISCSGNHVDILCSQIIFNYSNAPANGCATTGIQEASVSASISFYPNPVKDNLYLTGTGLEQDGFKIEITDLNGRMLLEKSAPIPEKMLNVSFLQPGIYMMTMTSGTPDFKFQFLKLVKL